MPKDITVSQTEPNTISRAGSIEPWSLASMRSQYVDDAMRLYRKAKFQAWLGKLKSAVTGYKPFLPDLNEHKKLKLIRGWQYIGIRDIPIQMIVGSEEPCRVFDSEFLPLDDHNRDRWLDIAFAKLNGIAIPPIELIQVPSGYYAQSGHYRISVFRSMGHKIIQAYVTSWDLLDRNIHLT
jgi:hypothetical protein